MKRRGQFVNMVLIGGITGLLQIVSTCVASAQETKILFRVDQTTCIEENQARRYVDDLKIDLNHFGKLSDVCKPKTKINKLMSALLVLDQADFRTNADELTRSRWINDSYYEYLKARIRGVTMQSGICGSADAGACVISGTLYIEEGWFTDVEASAIYRPAMLVHEARHVDGFHHESCTQGMYATDNNRFCDSSYQDGGANAVETEFYFRIWKYGKNFDSKLKETARDYFIDSLGVYFNRRSFMYEAVLLVEIHTNQIFEFRKDELKTWRVPRADLFAGQLLSVYANSYLPIGFETFNQTKRLGEGPMILDSDKTLILSPVELKNASHPILQRLPYEGRGYFLTADFDRSKLKIKTRQPNGITTKELDTSSFKIAKLSEVTPCGKTPSLRSPFFARTSTQEVRSIFITTDGTPHVVKESCRWPEELSDIIVLGKSFYGLSSGGEWGKWDIETGRLIHASLTENRKFTSAIKVRLIDWKSISPLSE